MMKSSLIAIVSVGVFAMTVGVESVNAQAYSPYSAPRSYTSRAYTPQSRGSVRRSVPRTAPLFSNPDSPAATGGGNLGYNQNLWNW
jgi:hypothetical protein